MPCDFHLDYKLSTTLVGLAGLLLSCIITFGNTELTTPTQCDGPPSFRPVSDYVWAFQTRLRPAKGCDTNLTSKDGEEVHLVVVKPPLPRSSPSSSSSASSSTRHRHHRHRHVGESSSGGGRRTIRLMVLARHRGSRLQYQDAPGPVYNISNRPMKFILVASGPVRWHVTLQGIHSTGEKHLFIISKDSNIKFSSKRTRLLAKSRKRELPSWKDSDDLIGWTTRRFGAITSRSEVASDHIKLFAGRNEKSLNVQCTDNLMEPNGRVYSSYWVAKPVEGCVALGYTHFMDAQTFVIELLKAPAVSTTITLEIMDPDEAPPAITTRDGLITRGSGGNGRRRPEDPSDPNGVRGKGGINIVIKSPLDNVKWMLKAGHIEEGVLNIVSNVDVNFKGVKANTEVSIRIEELDMSGKDLLQWTHKFVAPVQMYAGVQDVDTILVQKPPREKIKTQDSSSSSSSRKKVPYRNGVVGTKKEGGKPSWQHGDLGSPNTMGAVKGLQGKDGVGDPMTTSQMIQTRCDGDRLEVYIAKRLLEVAVADKSKISLRDPRCKMTGETDEFIMISAGLEECGTHTKSLDTVNSYSNEVVFRTPPDLINNLLQDELGSGFFEDELGSGNKGDGSTAEGGTGTGGDTDGSDAGLVDEDDEDSTPSQFRLSIECRAPEIQVPKAPRKGAVSLPGSQSPKRCSMNMYGSMFYSHSVSTFPVSITPDSFVHIKASLVGVDKTLIVDKCWLSTSHLPLNNSTGLTKDIITHGCRHLKSIEWLDETNVPFGAEVPETKFRFKLTEDFSSWPATYLHCQFHACNRNKAPGAHMCSIDPEERCNKAAMLITSPSSKPADCGPLTVGPLDLKSLATEGKGSKTVVSGEETGSTGQQRIIIEGLDSATVVGIAFASFIIGIVLVSVLWFIHSHTGTVKNGSSSNRSRSEVNTGGNITPNSSSPMTA